MNSSTFAGKKHRRNEKRQRNGCQFAKAQFEAEKDTLMEEIRGKA
jgi:hypothetical protein